MSTVIGEVRARDARFPLPEAAGSDAIHSNPIYSLAITELSTGGPLAGSGIVLTLGPGNELVCSAIRQLGAALAGAEIEELMAGFGLAFRRLADHPQLRWLGPHKGVVHLALASITNACFDLWAKSRGVPLWRLLLDLAPEHIAALLDLSYLEDALTGEDVLEILRREQATRSERESVLRDGYPGYDTSVGWFQYEDTQVRENALRARERGFTAVKLKVGSADSERDVRRARIVREAMGPDALIMLDANQQWSVPRALEMCARLREISPYWIEEPTHPDDVLGHRIIAEAIAPVPVALGEHVPNRVVFKNFIQAGAVGLVQVDCTRAGGVSEFLTVSLLARKYGIPVVPHVGDMGQIHQHLVLFNHVAVGHPKLFLEYIPHLRDQFVEPAEVEGALYRTPQSPGSSSDVK